MTVVDRARGGLLVAAPRWWGRPAVKAGVLTGVLSLIWAFWLARDAGDLAAQYAWTVFVRNHPGSAYNFSWYGGIHTASYSVLSPYLMAVLGVRTTGVLAATIGAFLGGLLLERTGIRRPLVPVLWLAIAVWCNLATGRVTYLLGMVFALGAAMVAGTNGRKAAAAAAQGLPAPVPVAIRRALIAAALGTVATLCSPVAGLFIEVLAAALWVVGKPRRAYLLAAGPPIVIGATALLFPSSGVQPFPWYSALPTVGVSVAIAVLSPREWRIVRVGGWVYAIGVVLCWALPTPIGSNVERLALLGATAVLICAGVARGRLDRTALLAYGWAIGIAIWTLVQPITNFVHTEPAPAKIDAGKPLVDELRSLGAGQGRVEVVPLRTHWEAAAVAPYLDLARGWNRQADVERNPIFYNSTLTPQTYRDWLATWGVGFVVLPTTEEPDSAGVAETKIITDGQAWLPMVWSSADWRVYKVAFAEPLASAPATVISAGPAAITVSVPRASAVMLRITWSPWLAIAGVDDDAASHACLAQEGPWTELVTPGAGTFVIEARYSLDRGTPCAKPKK